MNAAAEMGTYVAEAFFTYEQMREERDQQRGRAEVAEAETLAVAGERDRARRLASELEQQNYFLGSALASLAGPCQQITTEGDCHDQAVGSEYYCPPCVGTYALLAVTA